MAVARGQGRRRLPASMLLLAVSILVSASIAFIQWQQPGAKRLSESTSRAGQYLKAVGASIESRLVSEAAEGLDQDVGQQQQQQPAQEEKGERISGGGGAQEVGPADMSPEIRVQSEIADVKGDATSMSDVEDGRHAQYEGPPDPPPPPSSGNEEHSSVSFAGRSVHVCKGRGGMNLTTEIAEHIFPDMLLVKPANYSRAKSTDLLITNGKCPIRSWPGYVLYPDPERGRIEIGGHQRIFYMGAREPQFISKQRQQGFLAMIEEFHVATTILANKHYDANAFLQDRQQIQGHSRREKFMVYAHSNCVSYRETAFDMLWNLSESRGWDRPVAYGRCHGTMPWDSSLPQLVSQMITSGVGNVSTGKPARWDNAQSFRPFRFVLSMENGNSSGYVSEKIVNAFMAGAIPIYYGSRDVFKLFNREAFVFWDPDSPGEAIESITRLMEDESAFSAMLSRPMLADGEKTLREYFSLADNVGGGRLKHKIRSIIHEKMLDLESSGPIRKK